jgi:hypothetical protein
VNSVRGELIAAAQEQASNVIRKDATTGAIHIGANSLITNEVAGQQQLYAADVNDNPININVMNGSDLLVNNVSVATDADVTNERNARISADNALGSRIDENSRGIAMVAAMTNTTVAPGMTHGVDFNIAQFQDETGMSFGYANRINENLQIHAAAASTADLDEAVVRMGISVQW